LTSLLNCTSSGVPSGGTPSVGIVIVAVACAAAG
jgi:hypothetical protein